MTSRDISLKGAFLGTVFHTAVCYGAALVGLKGVDIGYILGDAAVPRTSARRKRGVGLMLHLLLGVIVFPGAFNMGGKHLLPKSDTVANLMWSVFLWYTGQHLVIPGLGKGALFKIRPDASLTYLAAHIGYALGCSRHRG